MAQNWQSETADSTDCCVQTQYRWTFLPPRLNNASSDKVTCQGRHAQDREQLLLFLIDYSLAQFKSIIVTINTSTGLDSLLSPAHHWDVYHYLIQTTGKAAFVWKTEPKYLPTRSSWCGFCCNSIMVSSFPFPSVCFVRAKQGVWLTATILILSSLPCVSLLNFRWGYLSELLLLFQWHIPSWGLSPITRSPLWISHSGFLKDLYLAKLRFKQGV